MAERSKAPDSSLTNLILCVLVSVYWRGFKSHCRQFFDFDFLYWEVNATNKCLKCYMHLFLEIEVCSVGQQC